MASGREHVMWLSGPAGAGKSAIAQTVTEECARRRTLVGAFFFSRAMAGRNTTENFVASLVYQLTISIPSTRFQIGQMIENDPLVFERCLQDQIETLLIPLFQPSPRSVTYGTKSTSKVVPPFLMIIDGLDECAGDRSQREAVEQLAALVNKEHVFLRCLISSRPEPPIAESIHRLSHPIRQLSLDDDNYIEQSKSDIKKYLHEGFRRIYHKRPEALSLVENPWPSVEVIDSFIQKSSGMFVYASTILKYIDDGDSHPVERLQEILHIPRGSKPFAEIDQLYHHILSTCSNTQLLIHIFTLRFFSFDLELFGVPRTPINGKEIECLLGLRRGTIATILRHMHSILRLESSSHITVLHASFRDFLYDKERAGKYFIDSAKGYDIMSQVLFRFIARSAQYESFVLPGRIIFILPYSVIVPKHANRIYRYALNFWLHCKEAGTYDESPNLLGELCGALELCYLHQGQETVSEAPDKAAIQEVLVWFEVVT